MAPLLMDSIMVQIMYWESGDSYIKRWGRWPKTSLQPDFEILSVRSFEPLPCSSFNISLVLCDEDFPGWEKYYVEKAAQHYPCGLVVAANEEGKLVQIWKHPGHTFNVALWPAPARLQPSPNNVIGPPEMTKGGGPRSPPGDAGWKCWVVKKKKKKAESQLFRA